MHSHMCTYMNMHTHLSKPPPIKSQLKSQEKQESLRDTFCLGLGQISLSSSPSFVWFSFAALTMFDLKRILGKCLLNLCLSHQSKSSVEVGAFSVVCKPHST